MLRRGGRDGGEGKVCDRGGVGVENCQNLRDVINERPQNCDACKSKTRRRSKDKVRSANILNPQHQGAAPLTMTAKASLQPHPNFNELWRHRHQPYYQ